MGKPGVMFYFEVRPCLKRLTDAERLSLFDAVLDYGEFGIVPELEGAVGVAWDFLQPKLDRDNERYNRVVQQKGYALYCRYQKQKNLPELSFDEWLMGEGVAEDYGRSIPNADAYQTTNLKQQTTNNKQQTASSNSALREPSATRPVFSPPGREDITAYCRETGHSIEVDSFLDYYEANGWMIGKSPMKDWKAAVRRWHRKEQGDGKITDSAAWDVGQVL